MRTYVFLDLDDTILQTRPKCPPDEPVRPAAYGRDGQPLSFTTDRQQALLDLFEAATVIPTTARNRDAFRRVRPQTMVDGADLLALLKDVQAFIAANNLGVNARLIADFDMPLYLVLKHPGGDCEALNIVRRDHWANINPDRFFVHLTGNNLSLVPRFLGKERAVRHVLDQLLPAGPRLTIGAGDSFTDAPFLGLCDFALVPRNSQLLTRLLAGVGR
jgi:hydroxymethylpyrimidine pyrophosphatase-like HAD family hydrolase